MKDKLYFENVIGVGNLYLEYVFLEYEKEPVFFTCIDECGQMYICLCAEIRGEQRWIITKCNIQRMRAIINGTIDMFSVFEVHENLFLIERNIEGIERSRIEPFTDIDPLDLPVKGMMLSCIPA